MFDHFNQQPTTPVAAPSQQQKVLRFDKNYIKSFRGILKLVQVVCNIIGFICIKVSSAFIAPIFYGIVYWVGNIVTLFLLLMYTFHFVEKYDQLPWLKCEFFYCIGMCLAYIVTSIIAMTISENVGYAVWILGLCAIVAYGIDGYLKYKAIRSGLPPQ